MVQAFLFARHMVIVGFSLTDDNFHRIVDAVRRLHSSTGASSRFGTTLTLGNAGLAEVLGRQDSHRVRMDERHETGTFPYAEVGPRLETFRAVERGLIKRDGAGRKSDPFYYWLPECEGKLYGRRDW